MNPRRDATTRVQRIRRALPFALAGALLAVATAAAYLAWINPALGDRLWRQASTAENSTVSVQTGQAEAPRPERTFSSADPDVYEGPAAETLLAGPATDQPGGGGGEGRSTGPVLGERPEGAAEQTPGPDTSVVPDPVGNTAARGSDLGPTRAEAPPRTSEVPTEAPGFSAEGAQADSAAVATRSAASTPTPGAGRDAPTPTLTFTPEGGRGPAESDVLSAAWACSDGAADLPSGKSTVAQMRALDGPAVFIPSMCLAAPYTEAGYHMVAYPDGRRAPAVDLSSAPMTSWYNESMPPGSPRGDTTMAQHMNLDSGDRSPFWYLHQVVKGTPIIVRDADGRLHVYKTTQTQSLEHGRTSETVEFTEHTGEPTLNLVTCLGSRVEYVNGGSHTEANLVVSASLVSSG